MPECYNFAANYLLFGIIEKKINIQLNQKKKMKKLVLERLPKIKKILQEQILQKVL